MERDHGGGEGFSAAAAREQWAASTETHSSQAAERFREEASSGVVVFIAPQKSVI